MSQPSHVGEIREFKCTSSVIFLTHPEFRKNIESTFVITDIYETDKTKGLENIWSTNDGQNVTNKEMKTLHVVLGIPVIIGKLIKKINDLGYKNSVSDIVAVEKHDEISKNDASILNKVLPTLNKNSKPGIAYAVPSAHINNVPKTGGLKKHMVINEIKVNLLTENGAPVAYVE